MKMSETLGQPPLIHTLSDYDKVVQATDLIQGSLFERIKTHSDLLGGELDELLFQDENSFGYLFAEKPIPEDSETRRHVIDEESDLLWFFTAVAHADGTTIEDICKRMQVAVGAAQNLASTSDNLDDFQASIEAKSSALPYFVKKSVVPVSETLEEFEPGPHLNEDERKLVRAVHDALIRLSEHVEQTIYETSPWQRHAEYPAIFGRGLLSGLRWSVMLVKAKGTGDWSAFEPTRPEWLDHFKEESIRYYIGVGVSYLALLTKQTSGLDLQELAQYSAEKTLRRQKEGSTFDKSKR